MKAMQCELCGSTDILKDGDFFVCQNCGTKYTPENAKKMMVEVANTVAVDASGSTIKVDNTDELSSLYQIARRAKENNDTEGAAKYYEMILLKSPTDWEAAFYSVYFRAMNCKIASIQSAAQSITNSIDSTLHLVLTNIEDEEKRLEIIKEIVQSSQKIANLLYQGAWNHFEGINSQIQRDHIDELTGRCHAAATLLYTLGDSIDTLLPGNQNLQEDILACWKCAVELDAKLTRWAQIYKGSAEDSLRATVNRYSVKIDTKTKLTGGPDYVKPNTEAAGCCYVATAVYGSYDCPQVWTLRRYRDYELAESFWGRAFIKTYYAISPTLVKWFGKTDWFKHMWRGKLDRMVNNLQARGFASTPYQDRNW